MRTKCPTQGIITSWEKIIKIRTVDNVSYKGEGRVGEMCGHNMNAILNSELWTMCTTGEKEGRGEYMWT